MLSNSIDVFVQIPCVRATEQKKTRQIYVDATVFQRVRDLKSRTKKFYLHKQCKLFGIFFKLLICEHSHEKRTSMQIAIISSMSHRNEDDKKNNANNSSNNNKKRKIFWNNAVVFHSKYFFFRLCIEMHKET